MESDFRSSRRRKLPQMSQMSRWLKNLKTSRLGTTGLANITLLVVIFEQDP